MNPPTEDELKEWEEQLTAPVASHLTTPQSYALIQEVRRLRGENRYLRNEKVTVGLGRAEKAEAERDRYKAVVAYVRQHADELEAGHPYLTGLIDAALDQQEES